MKQAIDSPIIAELWRRLSDFCDQAEADRLADLWIDEQVAGLSR